MQDPQRYVPWIALAAMLLLIWALSSLSFPGVDPVTLDLFVRSSTTPPNPYLLAAGLVPIVLVEGLMLVVNQLTQRVDSWGVRAGGVLLLAALLGLAQAFFYEQCMIGQDPVVLQPGWPFRGMAVLAATLTAAFAYLPVVALRSFGFVPAWWAAAWLISSVPADLGHRWQLVQLGEVSPLEGLVAIVMSVLPIALVAIAVGQQGLGSRKLQGTALHPVDALSFAVLLTALPRLFEASWSAPSFFLFNLPDHLALARPGVHGGWFGWVAVLAAPLVVAFLVRPRSARAPEDQV